MKTLRFTIYDLRFVICCLLFTLASAQLYAQSNPRSVMVKNDEGIDEEIMLPESMTADIDSLYLDWVAKNHIDWNQECVETESSRTLSDSIFIERLERLPAVIEMPYNQIVREFIDQYLTTKRKNAAFMLSANNFYMPIFEEALDMYSLPLELKYLPAIESGLNPSATSSQGASGLWQFTLNTAKVYGLKVTSLVDERRDPVKSTRAAVRYLKDLYDIYNDWNLVLAAYNCGPGTVNKAIRRAGGETDFWAIYNYLPAQTRGYVPGFIAVNYIMNYYCEHGIAPMSMTLPAVTDTVEISRSLNLNQVAKVCDISIEQLRSLNPEYKRDIIPGNEMPYPLRLPADKVSTFIELEESVYEYKVAGTTQRRTTVQAGKDGKEEWYMVKNGDTLGGIASKYGVSVRQIQELNGLQGTNIRAGKSLRIR